MIAIKHMLPINTKHNKPIVEAPSIKALCANDKIIPIKPITITGINVENITEANLEKNNVLLLPESCQISQHISYYACTKMQ